MRTETPVTLFLKDYTPPAWWIEAVDLHVAIHNGHAEVHSRLACTRNPAVAGGALVLNGEALELMSITLDGAAPDSARFAYADDLLTIAGPLPDACVLETVVRIDPDCNTQLSGLYRSRDGYFTQCEAEGFRRITFFPDQFYSEPGPFDLMAACNRQEQRRWRHVRRKSVHRQIAVILKWRASGFRH